MKMIITTRILSGLFFGTTIAFLFAFCNSETERNAQANHLLVLDSLFLKLETIGAVAHCSGPTGPYITQVYSSLDGETHFRQVYSNRSYVFEAILETTTSGFMLDYDSGAQEPLPEVVILVVRGHEFHKILCFPETFFSAITFWKEIKTDNKTYILFHGTDPSGKQATLTYDTEFKRLEKLEFTNPVDTAEIIEILPENWTHTDFGQQVTALKVVQARQDTFAFTYDSLSLNDQWIDLSDFDQGN